MSAVITLLSAMKNAKMDAIYSDDKQKARFRHVIRVNNMRYRNLNRWNFVNRLGIGEPATAILLYCHSDTWRVYERVDVITLESKCHPVLKIA